MKPHLAKEHKDFLFKLFSKGFSNLYAGGIQSESYVPFMLGLARPQCSVPWEGLIYRQGGFDIVSGFNSQEPLAFDVFHVGADTIEDLVAAYGDELPTQHTVFRQSQKESCNQLLHGVASGRYSGNFWLAHKSVWDYLPQNT